MTYLLDTNTCIRFLNGTSPSVFEQVRKIHSSEIVVCSIVKAELFFGAMKSHDPENTIAIQQDFLSQFLSLSFDDRCAEVYGEIRAHLAQSGTPIGPNDLFIAAIALANNLTLVTHNTREFGRVNNLQLEDWEIA